MVYRRQTFGSRMFSFVNGAFILLICFVTLYPFWFVLVASFSTDSYIAKGMVSFWPVEANLNAYKIIFNYRLIWNAYGNTVLYVALGTAVNLIMTVIGAYCLSRKHFYGRGVFMFLITFTMLFGGGMIPNYLVVKQFGMIDTVWAMVIPGAISTWNLIMMRTFFSSIPNSLLESAEIDGASEMTMMTRIVLPLSLASIMTIGLFYAVGHWNSYFTAVLYLNSESKFPLQLILREIVINNKKDPLMSSMLKGSKATGESVRYAAIVVAVVPILIVYPFIQKYFVKGVMIGSLKG